MIVQRWAIFPAGKYHPTSVIARGREPLVLDDGSELRVVELDDSDLMFFQAWVATQLGGEVLPSLTAPASAAGAQLSARLTANGITPAATDDIQQCVRKLRDARGVSAAAFPVDKAF